MKKSLTISISLLIILLSLSSCSSTDRLIKNGYSYKLTEEPATVQKVWLPRYAKYHKKQKRYRFVKGHYRIVLNEQTWTYRQARLRNRFGNL